MNTYGVLGLYIPAFGRIVGRMQYDLFHAYTVDAHTLFVVENLRRFALTRFDKEFPHCSTIMQRLEKPEVAYLAGLFHDIAKGRGGDHSELGAVDAEAFCREHGMTPLRGPARRMARAAPSAAVADGAEEGPERSERHQRVRAHRRRSNPSRLPVRAHRSGRARHESEDVELVEGHAVLRALPRARAGRCAAASRTPSTRKSSSRPGRRARSSC